MAVSRDYLDQVVGKLGLVTPIRAKAMFGGYGLYGNGIFFAVIDDDVLYFRVGPPNMEDFESRAMPWFDPMNTGKPMQYRQLPAGLLDNPADLEVWVEKSLAAAELGGKKKKK